MSSQLYHTAARPPSHPPSSFSPPLIPLPPTPPHPLGWTRGVWGFPSASDIRTGVVIERYRGVRAVGSVVVVRGEGGGWRDIVKTMCSVRGWWVWVNIWWRRGVFLVVVCVCVCVCVCAQTYTELLFFFLWWTGVNEERVIVHWSRGKGGYGGLFFVRCVCCVCMCVGGGGEDYVVRCGREGGRSGVC